MKELEELAARLRTFWLRDIGASSSSVDGTSSDGSVVLARTLFIPSEGGLVGINTSPESPYALDVVGNAQFAGNVLPRAANAWALGGDGTPWMDIYGATLHVGNLVAENKIATTGGRILVGPSTKLILAVTAGATTIDVANNTLASGDRIYLEAVSKLEWMAVTSGATAITGGYRYSVTRNLNGGGAQTWAAGDAVVNTGTTGQGFIDLYSRYGVPASGQSSTARQGPTITGNVRTGTSWDAIRERWAIGNLKGLFDYGSSVYGFAAGDPTAAWISADATNGIRLMNASTNLGQWTAAGGITIGEVAASKSNVAISSGALTLRNNTTERMKLTGAGVLTINDSAGSPVFTFDASAGAEFTKPLTLAATGGIYQGTGTFATPTTGLKLWNESGYGRIAGYNAGSPQWYADTDGKLYTGGGAVVMDATGITLASADNRNAPSALRWGDVDVSVYGYNKTGQNKALNLWAATNITGIETSVGLLALSETGYSQITLESARNVINVVGHLAWVMDNTHDIGEYGVGTHRPRNVFIGGYYVTGAEKGVYYKGTSGSTYLKAGAGTLSNTLTLPTSAGTLALTSDITSAVSGTSGTLPKFTGTNTIGDSLVSESGSTVTVNGSLALSGNARRITGEASSATIANRIHVQPSNTNTNGFLGIMPSGTATQSAVRVSANSNPDLAVFGALSVTAANGVFLVANRADASLTYPRLSLQTGGATRLTITNNGGVSFNATDLTLLSDAAGNVSAGGSIAATTSFVAGSAAAPGSPADGEYWNDSTQKALIARVAGVNQTLVGTIYTATANKTVANTTTETSIIGTGVGTLTLPATFWTVGKTIRIKGYGIFGQTNAGPTRTVKVKIGSVTLITTAQTVIGTAYTDRPFAMEAVMTCRTTGASGTVMGNATFNDNTIAWGSNNSATSTVDTTASAALDVTCTWSAANASNTITMTNWTVEVLN